MNDKVKNVEALRTVRNSQIELVHRVDGKRITFDAVDFANGRLAASGYNPDDWVPADEFEGLEPHPRLVKKAEAVEPAPKKAQ
jgi:hypothetical protein